MILFAIKRKGIEEYLPARKKNRGFSWDEPVHIHSLPPRLFTSWRSARNALTAWCMGIFKVSTGYTGGLDEGDWDHYIDVDPQSHRHKEEMEIVKFRLMRIK